MAKRKASTGCDQADSEVRTRDPALVVRASIAVLILIVDLSLVLVGGAVATGLLQVG